MTSSRERNRHSHIHATVSRSIVLSNQALIRLAIRSCSSYPVRRDRHSLDDPNQWLLCPALVTHFISPSAAAVLSTYGDKHASYSSKKPQVSASSILLHFLCSPELKMSLHHESGLLIPHFKVSCDLKRRRAFI